MGVPLATLQRQAQHSMNAISRRSRDFENIATTIGGTSPDEPYLLLQLVTKLQPLYASCRAIKKLPEKPKMPKIAENKKAKCATDDKNRGAVFNFLQFLAISASLAISLSHSYCGC